MASVAPTTFALLATQKPMYEGHEGGVLCTQCRVVQRKYKVVEKEWLCLDLQLRTHCTWHLGDLGVTSRCTAYAPAEAREVSDAFAPPTDVHEHVRLSLVNSCVFVCQIVLSLHCMGTTCLHARQVGERSAAWNSLSHLACSRPSTP